ncbi:MAG: glycogen synthase GlgA [Verrucomicrobia bacterium]|nr:glycogen synthase GlgA [Verrucomicrobiota bacterium]
MKILLASSEVHPYSKTGGLADMVGALAKTLAGFGHRVGLVTPLYAGVRERFPKIKKLDWEIELPLGTRQETAEVWTLAINARLTIYFIRHPDFYERKGLYQEGGKDYPDNAERFVFFSKCVAQLGRYLPWKPELIHVHDWQAALVPLFVRHQSLSDGWHHAPNTCLTIHNLAYQGNFPAAAFDLTNLPAGYFNPKGVEFYGALNCLKAGIVFSDIITTVSPRYAREIMTGQFGCGLEGVLQQRRESVFGILNGVDYSEWRTTRNPFLDHAFSVRSLNRKTRQKLALQKELGLPVNAAIPLFSTITRLADQKGVDILLGALEEMLVNRMQFVLLGSGSSYFESAYRDLAMRCPDKVVARIGFDQGLSHRIEAGSDFFVMPSRYEPCGLNQMYSQRYGTVPIVRTTGGLDDSVVDESEDNNGATGIKFAEYSAPALAKSIRRALSIFEDTKTLLAYRVNGMNTDFSWKRTGEQYSRVYELALNQHS